MPLHQDAQLFTQVFGTEPITTIELPGNLSLDTIISALITAACNCFTMQIQVQPLSLSEWAEITAKL